MADEKTEKKTYKVRAIARGHFGGQIREVGDEFEISAGTDLGGWMHVVSESDRKALETSIKKTEATRPKLPPSGNVRPTPAMRLV